MNVFKKNGKVLVSIVKADGNLKDSIKKAVNLIGGWDRLNLKGKIVLLKPNYNSADDYPASSDPEFIKAVIELVYENGADKVIVGESSMMTLDTMSVLKSKGLVEIANKTNADLYSFDDHDWIDVNVPNGKYLKKASIPKIMKEVDKLIFLPCLKTHSLAKFTMSIKLTMGAIKKAERVWIHLRKREEKIAELASLFQPDLIIMDGRKCFIKGGPFHGDVREPGLILASWDRIAIDVEGIKIIKGVEGNSLKKDPWDYAQIRRAVELGIGVKSEEDYEVIYG
ncbi:MAG: DUF362 domain-containing protein [Nitrososphaerales archaeon]